LLQEEKHVGSTPSNSYTGKCKPIKDHVFEVGSTAYHFVKTTKEIAGHIAWTVKNGADFVNAMAGNLRLEDLVLPDDPDPKDSNNIIAIERWCHDC
jgi:hypothetical protein